MSFLAKLFGIKLSARDRISTHTHKLIELEWQQIETMLSGGQPSQLKQALITADKAVDNVLKDLVVGETMGERLKQGKDLFKDWQTYDKIWKAHKMRNSLVHESGFEPPHYVLKEAVENLKRGLRDLGVNV